MSWNAETFLKLGRVSNLPTVWTNTLAGVVLAGSSPDDWRLFIVLLAMTLAYTGGMFLNDAFDKDIDAKERPERPIPSGAVSSASVLAAGVVMLGVSVLLIVWCAVMQGGGGFRAIAASVLLVVAIVFYNAKHKANPWSPVIMGVCRMLVYITAGWSLGDEVSPALYFGAMAMLCYLIGLTYTAKQENLGEVKNLWPLVFLAVPAIYAISMVSSQAMSWLTILLFFLWLSYVLRFVRRRQAGDIPRAVVGMIAGISLIDAMFIASISEMLWVILAILAFGLTLILQRYIAGT